MSAISVSAASRDKEPEYIVDERVWRSRDESISINFPLEFDHDRRLSVRLLRRGVERCRKEVDAKRGRRTAELCLSKDEEKLFQTGASHEPFELQVLSSDGSRLFSGSFFRFKSTKSKENREESAKPALVASSTPASSTRSSFSSASASARPVHVASSTPASSTTRSTFSSASVASNSLSYISSHRPPHYNLRSRIDDSMITPSTRSATTRTRSHYRELDSSLSTPAPADTSMRSSISSIRSSNPPLRLIPAGYEDYQESGPLSSTAYEEEEDEEYDYDQDTRNETSDDDDYGSQSQYRREESLGIRIDEKANSLIFSGMITPPKSTSTSSTNHRRIQITHHRRLDQYLVSEDEDDVYEDRDQDRDQRPPSTNFLTPSSTLKSRFSELESITQSIESPPATPTPKVPSTQSRRLTDISIHSFGLLLTDRDVPSHYRLLKPNIYVEKCEKTMISNHAVRVLVERFGVEFIAQFKVDVQVLTATRSGAVIANRNPLDTFFNGTLKQMIMARYEKEMSELDECLVKPEKAYKKLFGPMSPSSDLACEFVAKYGTMIMGCERDLRCELDPEHYKVVRNRIIEQALYRPIMAQKYNLPVEQSRYMMGVLDETGTLPEDTVYVAYRDFKGNVHYLDGVDVIIARTPCYSLSEMRRVRARKVDELSHLVNVVAFPKRGRRPLTNLLSGGDLDGDLYFVSWDGELTASVALNSRVNIDYPSREESSPTRSSGLRGGEAIRNELSQYFVRSCLRSNLIGLWHYKLTAIYDSDRSLMTSNQYLEAVKIVNAIIDNAPFKQSNQYFAHKPLWYLTSSQRSNIESCNNTKTKEEKIRSLYRLLIDQHYGDLNSKVANTSSSLLSRLAFATMRKLIELCTDYEQQPLPNGRFFTPDHIRRLEALELIDKDIFDVQLRPENIDKIKRRYDDYCRSHMALEAKKEKKAKPFMGLVESQEFNRRSGELDTAMIDLTRNFKSTLIRLPFDIEDIEGSVEWKSKHVGNNIYTRTRLIRLYEEFVGVYKYSQISWLFYEFLGSMKAELRHEQSRRKNSSLLPIVVRSDFL